MSTNLPKGIREKNGSYEARAMRNGVKISLFNTDLNELIRDFEKAKRELEKETAGINGRMTLDEWFEEWFTSVKSHKIKETSLQPMKSLYRRTFGKHIGKMRLKEIRPFDIQEVVNTMEKDGKSAKTISDALGKVRECMEFAVASRIVDYNPCIVVSVPYIYKTVKKEFSLTQEEQNAFLK